MSTVAILIRMLGRCSFLRLSTNVVGKRCSLSNGSRDGTDQAPREWRTSSWVRVNVEWRAEPGVLVFLVVVGR